LAKFPPNASSYWITSLCTCIRKSRRSIAPSSSSFVLTTPAGVTSHKFGPKTAALYYGVGPVETFSGGTEATAFNPRAVAALQRAGFEIARTSAGSNPRYQVQYSSSAEPITAFSKTYDSAENPQVDFAAVMTCANADRLCPVVRGASLRIATLYDDPKSADGTPRESQTYDECSSGSVANSFTCSRG
jgi:hypothetical protein